MKERENLKELLFIEILIIYIVQYFEVSEEDAFMFAIELMQKMDKYGIKIKE